MSACISRFINGLKIFCIIALVGLVTACGSPVNQSNYSKIKKDMTKEQVYSILGKPTKENNLGIAGFKGTSSVWKSGTKTITVQFMNDKVVLSTFTSDGADSVNADKSNSTDADKSATDKSDSSAADKSSSADSNKSDSTAGKVNDSDVKV